MKLVIEISEEEYNRMKEKKMFGNVTVWKNAICNGTPLPKGHGRLIDADRLKIDNPLHLSLDIPYVTEDTVEDIIDYAPTIIEADGGGVDEADN